MPYGYVLVEMNIRDMDQYRQYMAQAPAAVAAAGGEYLVRGGRSESLEGDWQPHRLAVLRFPSYEAAKAFYEGEQYQRARQHRVGTTEYFNMVLVEGAG
jgi:uncharacterized protein (DUF1330 family)